MTLTETPLSITTDRHPYGNGYSIETSIDPPKLHLKLTMAEAIEALEAWRDGDKFALHFEIEDFGTLPNNEPIDPEITFEIGD